MKRFLFLQKISISFINKMGKHSSDKNYTCTVTDQPKKCRRPKRFDNRRFKKSYKDHHGIQCHKEVRKVCERVNVQRKKIVHKYREHTCNEMSGQSSSSSSSSCTKKKKKKCKSSTKSSCGSSSGGRY